MNVSKNVGGRPRKKLKISINTRRKRIDCSENFTCSRRTMYRRAAEFLSTNNSKVFNIAARKKNISVIFNNDEIEASLNYKSHTKESVFAFYVDDQYSKNTCSNLAKDSKKHGPPIYPSYWSIRAQKRKCQPIQYLKKTEKEVAVSLQNLLNQTS